MVAREVDAAIGGYSRGPAAADVEEEFHALLRSRLQASKHRCQLRAARDANEKLLALYARVAAQSDGQRLCVAGDAARGAAASFMPPEFLALARLPGASPP